MVHKSNELNQNLCELKERLVQLRSLLKFLHFSPLGKTYLHQSCIKIFCLSNPENAEQRVTFAKQIKK